MTENTSWRSCFDDRMKAGRGNDRSSFAVRKEREMNQQNREHETNRDSFGVVVKMKGVKSALLTPDIAIARAVSTPIKCPSPSFADMNRDESIKQEEEYYNNRSWKLYNRITTNKNKKREQKGKAIKAVRRRSSILNVESSPDRFRRQQQRRRSSVATQQRRRSSTASSSFLPNMQYESRRSSMASTTSVEKGVFNLEF
ncbi:predicted protein [Chaetoceros tenuissimus]|uniref:Uncharacterized protein n=1 Tax=Chaetoceros tenuissimus TaxID=426638 RepID=A0AAD3DBA8_9STRA|nr:predicted protein [Chaetoceros tenuissimus]